MRPKWSQLVLWLTIPSQTYCCSYSHLHRLDVRWRLNRYAFIHVCHCFYSPWLNVSQLIWFIISIRYLPEAYITNNSKGWWIFPMLFHQTQGKSDYHCHNCGTRCGTVLQPVSGVKEWCYFCAAEPRSPRAIVWEFVRLTHERGDGKRWTWACCATTLSCLAYLNFNSDRLVVCTRQITCFS